MTNRLNFSALEIVAESENHKLIDDGIVPNIGVHARKVYREQMGTDKGYDAHVGPIRHSDNIGMCLGFGKGKETIYVVFCLYDSNPNTQLYRQAQEQTHALHFMGKIGLLHEKLLQRGRNLQILMQLANANECSPEEREVISHIGAIYALENSGFDVSIMPIEANHPEIQKALSLYLKNN